MGTLTFTSFSFITNRINFLALSWSFSCPSSQYQYSGCSTCFSVEDQPLDFDAASDFCLSRNGSLLTFNNVSDILRLKRYLEGLQIESQRIWVGFRLRDDNGRRILTTVERTDVPDDILDGSVRENFTSGGAGEMCVGMREGRFFADACSSSHHFLCAHTYSGNSGREWSWDIH